MKLKYNFVQLKNENIKFNLNTSIFAFQLLKFKDKRNFLFPFFSLLKITNNLKKNLYFFHNKTILNSILITLKQNYLALNKGFFLELLAVGVGFRFERVDKNSNLLIINVGYSHYIYYIVDKQISFRTTKGYLMLFSTNLNKLKITAIQIKQFKVPNIYTGKGIRYFKQEILLKPGKKKK